MIAEQQPIRRELENGIIEYRLKPIDYNWWYNKGKLHRTDGPAIEWPEGHKFWYLNGDLHRDDGPAVEWADGAKEWWKDGIFIKRREGSQ